MTEEKKYFSIFTRQILYQSDFCSNSPIIFFVSLKHIFTILKKSITITNFDQIITNDYADFISKNIKSYHNFLSFLFPSDFVSEVEFLIATELDI